MDAQRYMFCVWISYRFCSFRVCCVIERTWWAYLMKVIERTWWRSLSVPDEGYSRNASCTLSLISTFYSLHSVSTESYRVYHVSCTLDQYTNIVWTNDIEHRSGNPKWTIQRNRQHRAHKMNIRCRRMKCIYVLL